MGDTLIIHLNAKPVDLNLLVLAPSLPFTVVFRSDFQGLINNCLFFNFSSQFFNHFLRLTTISDLPFQLEIVSMELRIFRDEDLCILLHLTVFPADLVVEISKLVAQICAPSLFLSELPLELGGLVLL